MKAEEPTTHAGHPPAAPLDWLIGALLALVSVAVFWPAVHYPFLIYDDPEYVSAEPMVNQGWRSAAVLWTLTQPHAGNWHPLTTFAHMTVCECFDLDPGAHHAVNLLVHAANAALCFAAFLRLTGRRWPSALVAAVFALHPLRVESVAWVSELKDLLCGMFWFLTLLAYARYCGRPTRGRALLVLAGTVAALLAKPMAVTLPFTLLLLDYWPLQRWPAKSWRVLVGEKVWLILAALATIVLTAVVQLDYGAGLFGRRVPFDARLGNAVVCYLCYLGKFFWPADLAAFYPHPIWRSWAAVLSATLALLALSTLVWRGRRSQPWLFMGWLWFLLTLGPVIGLVQVGYQAMANRYTYIPALGLAVAVTWTAATACTLVPWRRWAGGATAGIALLALIGSSRTALAPWGDSVTLFQHSMLVSDHPTLNRYWLGLALHAAKRDQEALEQLNALVQEDPDFLNAYTPLSALLVQSKRPDEAVTVLRAGVTRNPDNSYFWNNLGYQLLETGALPEAGEAFQRASRLAPKDGAIDANLALYYARTGQRERVESCLREAIRKSPWVTGNYNDLAVHLGSQGYWSEPRELLEKGLWINPRQENLLRNYATLLERQGEGDAARKYRAEAVRWKPAPPL